jgi:hypothetical protein
MSDDDLKISEMLHQMSLLHFALNHFSTLIQATLLFFCVIHSNSLENVKNPQLVFKKPGSISQETCSF